MDHGARYYRLFFVDHEHQNYFGVDEQLGPLAVSLRRETRTFTGTEQETTSYVYRVIVRTPQLEVLRCCVLEDYVPVDGTRPKPGSMPAKEVLQFVAPGIPTGCLRLAQPGQKIIDRLLKLDEQSQSRTFKFGVLYCRAGQSTEEEFYNNECGSEGFMKFLTCLGDVVDLLGFEGYRAQLDNKHNSTGQQSVYTRFHGNEIMFHVSTMLPYIKDSRQQLQRKRHIGNDIVTVVYQEEGSSSFTPACIRSHFQHVFIVVRELKSLNDEPLYAVAVTCADGVPAFGPPLLSDPVFKRGEDFREFLLTKLINAEGASHRSFKFLTLTRRTRFECLQNLAEEWTTTQPLEPPSGNVFHQRFAYALKGKKKSLLNVRSLSVSAAAKALPGGVAWQIQVVSWGVNTARAQKLRCSLCISPSYVLLLSLDRRKVLFCVHSQSIIAWTLLRLADMLVLYYNRGDFIKFTCISQGNSLEELDEVIIRLYAVTKGCFTLETNMRKSSDGHLGFTVRSHGVVGEVDPYSIAWKAGLREGARLLEINGVSLYGQNPTNIIREIRTANSLTVVYAPPDSHGKIRGEPLQGRWEQVVQIPTQPAAPATSAASTVNSNTTSVPPVMERVRAFSITPSLTGIRRPVAKTEEGSVPLTRGGIDKSPFGGSVRNFSRTPNGSPINQFGGSVKAFDRNRLTMQKRRFDKQWELVVKGTSPRSAQTVTPTVKDAPPSLRGVVEKAKRALVASGLSESPSSAVDPLQRKGSKDSQSSGTSSLPRHINLILDQSGSTRPATPLSPIDPNWCGPVSVEAQQTSSSDFSSEAQTAQPAAAPFATCSYARPLSTNDKLTDQQTTSEDISQDRPDLSRRLVRAESEVARLQDELARVHQEKRVLSGIVSQLRAANPTTTEISSELAQSDGSVML